ncbi:MAG TPA: HAD family hydrolase, partial [Candidatus Dependentiae bacterium]|nr:HAD family hydrolase [Candidatus Dependentiae bacterium]
LKTEQAIDAEVPVADQINMAFKGTYILAGSGKAIVVATGIETEIGKIHRIVEEIQTEMPLKIELERLSYWILFFILCMCVLLFFIGLLIGKPFQELLIMLTALFICVVPEGLPVVLTLVLVTGVYRMAKQNVLVKKMQAVEALGRANVIVIDKTGTLTRNEMIVAKAYADNTLWEISGQGYFPEGDLYYNSTKVDEIDDQSALMFLGKAASLLNSTEITYLPEVGLFDIKGDPTEAALFILSQKLGLSREQLDQEYKKVYEIPFDPHLQYHAGFYQKDEKGVIFLAGSPEIIIQRSHIDEAAQKHLTHLLDEGLRIVGLAMKEFDVSTLPSNEEAEERRAFFEALINNNYRFLGWCGIQDSIRPEVRSIVDRARKAGLRVIMATGDHQKTALYVAKKVGIFRPGDIAIDGAEFDQRSDDELLQKLGTTTVYSRVSPEHKLRIIDLFHKQNNVVAMTGDGINDAPSLVAADLGIAMGRIGTEVAKQASDIILLDDSFVNIISAVEQGRHIFYTLRRVILYFFATNMGEILIIFFALILGFFCVDLPLPITAAQILWLNFVTDGFLDVALSMESKEKGLLEQRWLERKFRLVDTNMFLKMLFMAIPMAIGSLGLFYYYYQMDLVHARTMTLIAMAMFQWFNAWNCRSETLSTFQLGLFTNKWLIVATSFVLLLQFLLLHVPFMQRIFKTVPLTASEWGLIFLITFPIFLLEELRKWVVRTWMAKDMN